MTLMGLFHENNDGSDYFNQNSKLEKNWSYSPQCLNEIINQHTQIIWIYSVGKQARDCTEFRNQRYWRENGWRASLVLISVWVLDFGEKKKADSREDSRPPNDLYSAALGRDRKALLIINHTKHLLHHELKFRPLG